MLKYIKTSAHAVSLALISEPNRPVLMLKVGAFVVVIGRNKVEGE